jgi:hypothetical protein
MSGISSQQKEGSSKKSERSKDWKAKEVKPHMKSSIYKKEDKIYKLLGEIISKERKKGDHIFL